MVWSTLVTPGANKRALQEEDDPIYNKDCIESQLECMCFCICCLGFGFIFCGIKRLYSLV